jgi:hypothetical protein
MRGKLRFEKHFFASTATIKQKIKLISSMSKSSTFAIGIGLASGALLAAWLLTGTRKEKTKKFIYARTASIKKTIQAEKPVYDETESFYF